MADKNIIDDYYSQNLQNKSDTEEDTNKKGKIAIKGKLKIKKDESVKEDSHFQIVEKSENSTTEKKVDKVNIVEKSETKEKTDEDQNISK
jgi:hypothetical protein